MSDDIPNYHERFAQMADGAFSQIENHIGSDLYQANVEHAKVSNAALKEYAEWSKKKHDFFSAMMGLFAILLLAVAVPLMVMLWKVAWAL